MNDTTPKMQAAYWKRVAEMTPSEKSRVTAALWDVGHALQCAGVRQRYPEASEDEVIFQVAVLRYGLEYARKAYRRGT